MKTRSQKRLALTSALSAAILAVSGCSTNSEESGSDNMTLTFGHVQPESHSQHTCLAMTLQDDIESANVGLDVQILSSGQGYQDSNEQMDALETGSLAATTAGMSQLGSRVEEFSIFEAVYIFDDVDEMQETVDGEVLEGLRQEVLDTSGIRVLATGYGGTRHLTANAPVRTPDDMNGVKLRVIDAPIWIDNGAALGATPTPVAFGELYLGLQQGVVDAQENPLPTIESNAFFEVQDYLMLTGHSIIGSQILFSDVIWEQMTEEQQSVVSDATANAAEVYGECLLEEEEQLLDEWSQDDSPITIVEDVDVEAFADTASAYLETQYADRWDGLYLELSGN